MATSDQRQAAVAAALAAKAARATVATTAKQNAKLTLAEQIEAWVVAYANTRRALSQALVAKVAARVRAFDGWYDSGQITQFAQAIARDVEAVQRRTASVTDAYLSKVSSAQAGRRLAPAGQIDVTDLRGIRNDSVYGRLADNYRYLVSTGMDENVAQDQVVRRAEVMADTDATLAMRHQSQAFMAEHADSIDGYRRVLHPELSHKTGVCGLCIVASDRTYYVEDLLPCHDGCNCSVLPIIDGNDPGHNLNQKDLSAIYKAAGSNRAGDLVKVRVQQHSELGPILTNAGYQYRDPGDVAKDADTAAPVAESVPA